MPDVRGWAVVNLTLLAHDPDTGRVQLYRLALSAVIERTGRVGEWGEHEVQVRQVAGRDFIDGNVGAALVEVLGLDPLPIAGEQDEQQQGGGH